MERHGKNYLNSLFYVFIKYLEKEFRIVSGTLKSTEFYYYYFQYYSKQMDKWVRF